MGVSALGLVFALAFGAGFGDETAGVAGARAGAGAEVGAGAGAEAGAGAAGSEGFSGD